MNLKSCLYFTLLVFSTSVYAQHDLESDMLLTPYTVYEDTLVAGLKDKAALIMEEAIKTLAFPGAQFMAVKEGEVIFHETYGYHTYDSLVPVGRKDLYDLASVTKIAGPLPALMKLVEEGKIDLDAPFSNYWEPWKNKKDKAGITFREVLAHQAGLKPYIAFMNHLMTDEGYNKKYVNTVADKKYTKPVNNELFVSKKFSKRIVRDISKSSVSDQKTYKYSGLSFLLYPDMIEQITGMSYRTYVRKNFYEPIGATTLMFNPKGWYPEQLIVPTEKDTLFRKSLVKGYVHDENAAIMGGVSGNAGLFGTAEDLARLMQLYLNKGVFNGKQILSEAVVNEFTRVQFPENGNRRGLGFDKPLLDNGQLDIQEAYPAPGASEASFGHSGFTGTFVWADPQGEWIFVFLSNRVYPDRSHRAIYSLKVRERLMQLFYETYQSQ
ncbi:class C beta-lactamase-related serine hydrolase [Robertkochia marina]|uniref:Class C beta-lactamase-related serine hydrolase n=1 Tax=Robertkochia marina TaxID=1227945 RepID=A0A4S3LYA0_9FLAO|nr:serine hydrolase [Robertkochia marina]THD66265.1 class C beta-lactamase-related serine hydrolase [Robertkochia marina]TRZ40903.1 class C beta-lactamase-related serine hydrolase [Robertkochia marina]